MVTPVLLDIFQIFLGEKMIRYLVDVKNVNKHRQVKYDNGN